MRRISARRAGPAPLLWGAGGLLVAVALTVLWLAGAAPGLSGQAVERVIWAAMALSVLGGGLAVVALARSVLSIAREARGGE